MNLLLCKLFICCYLKPSFRRTLLLIFTVQPAFGGLLLQTHAYCPLWVLLIGDVIKRHILLDHVIYGGRVLHYGKFWSLRDMPCEQLRVRKWPVLQTEWELHALGFLWSIVNGVQILFLFCTSSKIWKHLWAQFWRTKWGGRVTNLKPDYARICVSRPGSQIPGHAITQTPRFWEGRPRSVSILQWNKKAGHPPP